MKSFALLFLIFFVSCYNIQRDCAAFRTGSFEYTTVIAGDTLVTRFERSESREIDFYLGKADTAQVRWVNDCECILKKTNPQTPSEKKAIQMKILSTTENSYTFEYHLVGDTANKQRGTAFRINQ